MRCMRSGTMGTYRVNIPEEDLTTLDLDFYQLRRMIGPTLAEEYVRCHDYIVRHDYWVPPYRDPLYGVVLGGWHTSRAWRVQYLIGRYAWSHINAPPDTGTSANNGADYSTDTDIEESIPMSLAGCSRLPGDLNVACKLKRYA
jgi:hypothetical protein